MNIEIDSIKFTRSEVEDLVNKLFGTDENSKELTNLFDLLIKLGVISEYVFAEEKRKKKDQDL